MNLINRWKEYDAKTLTPPCVVQHDLIGEEHLVWVWTGEKVVQTSRKNYDEAQIIESILALDIVPVENIEITNQDGTITTLEIPI